MQCGKPEKIGLPSCPDAQWIYRFHPDFHHSMCNGIFDLKRWQTWLRKSDKNTSVQIFHTYYRFSLISPKSNSTN